MKLDTFLRWSPCNCNTLPDSSSSTTHPLQQNSRLISFRIFFRSNSFGKPCTVVKDFFPWSGIRRVNRVRGLNHQCLKSMRGCKRRKRTFLCCTRMWTAPDAFDSVFLLAFPSSSNGSKPPRFGPVGKENPPRSAADIRSVVPRGSV